jgi:PadR family transcriptional regulator
MRALRMTHQTLRVLECFLEYPRDWRYGYNLSGETGLKAGTLYPILFRLAKFSFLETRWVTTEKGVPPRHIYRLTSKGLEESRARLAEAGSERRVRRLAVRPEMV